MDANGLAPTAPAFDAGTLAAVALPPAALLLVTRHAAGAPLFGAAGSTGGGRFDAPGGQGAAHRVCYLGRDLAVALAETVLHDEIAEDGQYRVDVATLEALHVAGFAGRPLLLADLTGFALKRAGGHADLATTADYGVTRQWALAVHRDPVGFDGLLYMSRHTVSDLAVALFDRAGAKMRVASHMPLPIAPGFAAAAAMLGIDAV